MASCLGFRTLYPPRAACRLPSPLPRRTLCGPLLCHTGPSAAPSSATQHPLPPSRLPCGSLCRPLLCHAGPSVAPSFATLDLLQPPPLPHSTLCHPVVCHVAASAALSSATRDPLWPPPLPRWTFCGPLLCHAAPSATLSSATWDPLPLPPLPRWTFCGPLLCHAAPSATLSSATQDPLPLSPLPGGVGTSPTGGCLCSCLPHTGAPTHPMRQLAAPCVRPVVSREDPNALEAAPPSLLLWGPRCPRPESLALRLAAPRGSGSRSSSSRDL
ncbi:hypothetical protein H8959_003991 [Pygathrix nigripes]